LDQQGFTLATQQLEIAQTKKRLTELERRAAYTSIKILISALEDAVHMFRESHSERLAALQETARWKAAIRSHYLAIGEVYQYDSDDSDWSNAETFCEDVHGTFYMLLTLLLILSPFYCRIGPFFDRDTFAAFGLGGATLNNFRQNSTVHYICTG
jgi:hypothetical protein